MEGLFVRKSIDALQAEAGQTGVRTLKRVLGPVSLVALGVGVIIGAGLFSITGTVASEYTGPAITLSFIIAAIGCCFAGLCYAEFASMIPVAGSAYTYSYATMGELIAWIIGWDLVLEYTVAATTVSISWSRYLVVFLQGVGIDLPHAWNGGQFVLQRTDCILENQRDFSFRFLRMEVYPSGELCALHPGEYRNVRRVRLFGHLARSGYRVLRFLGIRCGEHGGARDEKPQA